MRSSPWDAAACAACDTARPAADARDAARGKRLREHDALEAPAATPAGARKQALSPSRPAKAPKRLAFGEQAPAASSVAKNLVSAFGFLRKLGREEAALFR